MILELGNLIQSALVSAESVLILQRLRYHSPTAYCPTSSKVVVIAHELKLRLNSETTMHFVLCGVLPGVKLLLRSGQSVDNGLGHESWVIFLVRRVSCGRGDVRKDSLESYRVVFLVLPLSLDLTLSMAKSDLKFLNAYP